MHPSTRRPYILSISGGKDISIEKLQVLIPTASLTRADWWHQNGISHAFVLQFNSNEDRDYYVDSDPVHQAFKEAAGAIVEKTIVVDFQDGVFTKTE